MDNNTRKSPKTIHIVFQVLNFLHSDHHFAHITNSNEHRMLTNLASHNGPKGICPAIETIATELKLHTRTAQRLIRRWEELGVVQVQENEGKANSYLLFIPKSTPGAGATPDTDVTPGAGATPDTDVTPGAGATPDTDVTPGAGATPDTDVTPGAGATPDTDVTPGAGATPDTDVTPGAGATPPLAMASHTPGAGATLYNKEQLSNNKEKLFNAKAENEKRHDFADSKDQMASEKKHIEKNEKFKKAPMPESLRQFSHSLKTQVVK